MASRTYSQLASLYLTYAVIPATLTYTQLATSPALTGTITGSSSTASSLTGKAQRLGTISASSSTTGVVIGREEDLGVIAGSSSTTANTLTGLAALFGTSGGSSSSLGTVVGREEDLGLITGTTPSSEGAANGSPALVGTAAGTSTSTGTIISRPPQLQGGGIGRPRRVAYTPQPTMHLPRFGWVYGLSLEDGKVIGQRGQAGQTFGVQSNNGTVAGKMAISANTIKAFAMQASSPIVGHITIREDGEQELLAALGYL